MAKTKEKPKPAKATKPTKPTRPEPPRARNDAYVMMLFITLVAIIGGTVMMYLDTEEYGSKTPPDPFKELKVVPKLGEATKLADLPGGGAPKVDPGVDPKVDPKVEPPKM